MSSDPAAANTFWQVPWGTRLVFTIGVSLVLYSIGCSDFTLSCVAGPIGYWVLCRSKEQRRSASNYYERKVQKWTNSTAWLYVHHTGWLLGTVRCFWQLLCRESFDATATCDSIWDILWLPRGLLRWLQAWFGVQLYWPLLILLLGIYSRVVFHQMWELLNGQTEWVWCLPAFSTCWQYMKREAHNWGLITFGATESDAAADADAANQITILKNTIDRLQNSIHSLTHEQNSRASEPLNHEQMKQLQSQLDNYEDQLAVLTSSLSSKDTMIDGLQQQAQENKTQLATLTQQLQAADDKIEQLQAEQPPLSGSKRRRTEDFVDHLHSSPKQDKYCVWRLYEVEVDDQEKLCLYIGIVQHYRGKWQIKWLATAEPSIDRNHSFTPGGNPTGDLRKMCDVHSDKIKLNSCNDRDEVLDENWFKDPENKSEYVWCSATQASIWQLYNIFEFGNHAKLRALEEFMTSRKM